MTMKLQPRGATTDSPEKKRKPVQQRNTFGCIVRWKRFRPETIEDRVLAKKKENQGG
jgi:hypothetical protein